MPVRLDLRPYQAAVERTQAALIKARAEADLAALDGLAAMSKEDSLRL
jgi:hypothetical protein